MPNSEAVLLQQNNIDDNLEVSGLCCVQFSGHSLWAVVKTRNGTEQTGPDWTGSEIAIIVVERLSAIAKRLGCFAQTSTNNMTL